jgi:uncharacterized MAPEG superfamily protein
VTTPFWCLLVTVLIPYFIAGTTGYLKSRDLGSVDNDHPRDQATQFAAGSAGRRAVAAQQNAWEATAVFTAAVLVAHLAGAAEGASAAAALVFVVARVAHAFCYVSGLATLRSVSFLVATVCCLTLFGLAIRA